MQLDTSSVMQAKVIGYFWFSTSVIFFFFLKVMQLGHPYPSDCSTFGLNMVNAMTKTENMSFIFCCCCTLPSIPLSGGILRHHRTGRLCSVGVIRTAAMSPVLTGSATVVSTMIFAISSASNSEHITSTQTEQIKTQK